MATVTEKNEWLEPDGLGGFASGTAALVRTRRYHALLLSATTPPTGRMVLVNGFEAWIETPAGAFALSSQRYGPDVVHPDGRSRVAEFTTNPWPRWLFTLEDGTAIAHTIVGRHGSPLVALTWQIIGAHNKGALSIRLLFSGRDYHALHRENGAFRFEPDHTLHGLVWRPYPGVPRIRVRSNGQYVHEPQWYRNFCYDEERARGLDYVEDLASPGVFRCDLEHGEAILLLASDRGDATDPLPGSTAADDLAELRDSEIRRRSRFPSPLHRAADAYVVTRGEGKTILAGYPWFTDWGRDTFIALRGICLAADRIDEARQILLEWSKAVSMGMLPNRFPDRGESPEFNSVDASLWFVIAVHELFDAARRLDNAVADSDRLALEEACDAILSAYAGGTRYGIKADDDGLLAAGVPGVQLTWMDAKVGGHVITPRIGKPVEVQALWLNALWLRQGRSRQWSDLLEKGQRSFEPRFWNEAASGLYDVIDVDHRAGAVDPSFRPNQIFALGGLPLTLVGPEKAARAIDRIESRLWTPLGLRSLAPGEPGYAGTYAGGVLARDSAYHQGTVWPWLLASFVDAWVRVRGGGDGARKQARDRFLTPLLQHLDETGLGHISEIADGDAPHTPRGCPFQAWSVGEALRLERLVESIRPGHP